MSKQFSDIPLHQFDQVKTDNVTKNLDKYLSTFNGSLDSNNLPVLSVTEDKLLDPIAGTSATGVVTKTTSIYPSQTYHFSRRSTDIEGGNDVSVPLIEVDLDSDTWSAGLNRLVTFDSNFQTWPLQFDAREGMLVGCVTMDWEHGNNVFNTLPGPSPRGRGNEWWTEWVVFVNNVPVAKTGWIFPRRHTTQIPFAIACGSQPVNIEARVRINTWWVDGAPTVNETESTPFKVFSGTIWCRNHYR